MRIDHIIDTIQTGELRNLEWVKDPKVVLNNINMALLELYKRFPILTDEHIVPLKAGKTIYNMPENFMYIMNAYEEVDDNSFDHGVRPVAVNEEENAFSINTISYNQVGIPLVQNYTYISIIYGASPDYVYQNTGKTALSIDYYIPKRATSAIPGPPTKMTTIVPSMGFYVYDTTRRSNGTLVYDEDGIIQKLTPKVITSIPIPPQMVEALTSYVAYRSSLALNSKDSDVKAYQNKFELSCNAIKQLGLFTNNSLSMIDRYREGVWV